jgi:hypothetical protein
VQVEIDAGSAGLHARHAAVHVPAGNPSGVSEMVLLLEVAFDSIWLVRPRSSSSSPTSYDARGGGVSCRP